ncbi:T9SS type A sorting domain-containing protein [Polaribacter sp. SA4-12]|uniref:T9SS type A sorting domain-containing protein n=1 Tax=Polaribacter sp. SA4-12 TaxID=1312072 RepID=UPI000B3CA18A|nr:T9SS type A sorting domain-containing protein [Polaribacter sp. SA4-12]ARV15348.1 hypothetical protein BTO07_09430 [Polaribacter sp. SA4-12]
MLNKAQITELFGEMIRYKKIFLSGILILGLLSTTSFTIKEIDSPYNFVALNDIDNDGILNDVDLDDDNDGILDTDENDCPSAAYIDLGQAFTNTNTGTNGGSSSGSVANIYSFGSANASFSYELTNSAVWVSGVASATTATVDGTYINVQPKTTNFPNGSSYPANAGTISVAVYTLTFSEPVYNVEFKWGGLDFDDRIDFSASLSGADVPLEVANNNLPSGQYTINDQSVVSLYTTGDNAPNNSVIVSANGPINKITFIAGKEDGDTGNVTMQLFELKYCLPKDTDGDGIPNHLDLDSDNDGITDVIESGGTDANRDGKADGTIGTAPTTNGVPSTASTGTSPTETADGDTIPDYLDIDADNDGIPDNVEAQTTNDYTAPSGIGIAMIDLNKNGVDDSYEVSGIGFVPTNTDNTDNPDYIDTDTDNDGTLDIAENGDATNNSLTGIDTDGDGLYDIFDDNNGVNNGINPPNAGNLGDADSDLASGGNVDFRDTPGDSDNDTIADEDDLDDDNDGILDIEEGCTGDVALNGDFETVIETNAVNTYGTSPNQSFQLPQADVVNWSTTAADGIIEIWDTNHNGGDPAPTPSYSGDYHAEINATDESASLYQDITTVGGQVMTWSIYHRGRRGLDVANVNIGNTTTQAFQQQMSTDNSAWVKYSGTYIVPAGQTTTRISFTSVSSNNGGGPTAAGNFIDLFKVNLCNDTDGDGIPNSLDLDSDNDGITDVIEAGGIDANRDGKADGTVGISGNTLGVPSSAGIGTNPTNSDSDTIDDYLDIDADNDGIPDNIEAQPSGTYIEPSDVGTDMTDVNNNGLDDVYEVGGIGFVPENTDGTDTADYLDLDSDNDGIPDITENGDTDNVALGTDADNDGLDDAFDDNDDSGISGATVNDGLGVGNKVTDSATLETAYGDEDSDFNPGTGDVDYRDSPDADNDGIPDNIDLDDDNDGIPDTAESGVYLHDADEDGDGIPNYKDTTDNTGGDGNTGTDYTDLNGDGIPDVYDNDGDGIPNHLDLDSDNDGIPDIVEAGGEDTDGNGLIDDINTDGTLVNDTDNDGLDDRYDSNNGGSDIANPDTDGDGIPNTQDLDADNDGIPDVVEAGGTDANGDGRADNFIDTDNDGFNDVVDGDVGQDGISENTADVLIVTGDDANDDGKPDSYPNGDTDSDGIPSYLDLDADNDGIPDVVEAGGTDANGDGKADNFVDADNDGFNDVVDGDPTNALTTGTDTAGANTSDALILTGPDAGGDGKPDSYPNGDTDGDGILDNLDLDADNDGIPDVVEAGGTDINGDGIADDFIDADNDGFNDVVDADPTNALANGTDTAGANTSNALILTGPDASGDGNPDSYPNGDTDNDGILDNLDLDADNDGIPDVVEAGGTDINGDGIADDFIDADNDGFNDVVDADPTNALANGTDTAGANTSNALILTGTDDDNNGTPNTYPNGDTDGDGILDNLDLDADNDGIPDVVEAGGTDTNGDGKADNFVDADNDGFNDVVDGDPTNALANGIDTAGANTSNALILTGPDAGGDGNPDSYPNGDTDGDGILDNLDLDADNDGIPDVVEAGGTDVNGDGIADDFIDADNDGFNDVVDADPTNALTVGTDTAGANTSNALIITGPDAGGDGEPDSYPNGDTDGDGILDLLDLDSDNDGITDVIEAGGIDADRDGKADGFVDADTDGFNDLVDGDPTNVLTTGTDTAGANTSNALIVTGPDAGGDGKPDSYPNGDLDNDGKLNHLDIDTDNDGIPDNIEAQPSGTYIEPSDVGTDMTDVNNNGVDDVYEVGGIGFVPENTDGTDTADYLDLDSDNDGIPDITENGDTDNVALGTDADNDGLDDAFDDNDDSGISGATVNDGLGVGNKVTDSATLEAAYGDEDSDFNFGTGDVDYRDSPDADNDGIPDNIDLDDDNDGIPDTDESGVYLHDADEDGDGIPNYKDTTDNTSGDGNTGTDYTDLNGDGIPDVYDNDGDGIPNHLDLDSDNDGIPDIVEAGGEDTDGNGLIDDINTDGTLVNDTDNDGLDDRYDSNNGGSDIANPDTDGDGIPNTQDLDADNDGIPDVVEAGGTDANGDGRADNFIDTDNDGFNDVVDGDVGQDGISENTADVLIVTGDDANDDGKPDSYPNGDTDSDGIPSYLDLDADNDGIPDVVEAGGTDANGDGKTDNFVDADNDGFNDVVDGDPTNALTTGTDTAGANTSDALILTGPDAGGDGKPDSYPNGDTDGDGILDNLDLDADNDGIPDVVEAGGTDANGDGRADNFAGNDADNDGFNDDVDGDPTNALTVGTDTAGANTSNALILTGPDAGGDGNPDSYPNGDNDNDGILDHLDLDADNDGIPDVVEAGGTDANGDGRADNFAGNDVDNDGFNDDVDGDPTNALIVGTDTAGANTSNALIITGTDDDNNGTPNTYPNGDTDGDGILDNLDLDADNDGIPDVVEAGGTDANGDGIADDFIDADTDGFNDVVDGDPTNVLTSGTDTAGDNTSDALIVTGTDTDNDGQPNSYPNGDTDGDGILNYLDLDSDNDGITDVVEAGGTDADRDGKADGFLDADTDGFNDLVDGDPTNALATGTDTVGANTANALILTGADTSGDGNPDTYPNGDSDTDGKLDFLDIDADNDGIPDNIEGQPTRGYIAPSDVGANMTDVNNNGLDDNYENGALFGIVPENTDGVDNVDYLDADSDNDGIDDILENGNLNALSGVDTDGDGLDDNFEHGTNNDAFNVNDGINIPNKASLGDVDDDATSIGDLDYRDTTINGIPMITQVYHFGSEKWIEITNIGVNSIAANIIKIQLYKDRTGDQTGIPPNVTYTVTTPLNPGESVLFKNTANAITNISGTATVIDNATFVNVNMLTDIGGANDIITLSTLNDATSWTKRYDVISGFVDKTSYVRIDETLVPNNTYTASEWVLFIDDALDPYRLLSAGGAQRHPHDPLISEITSSNTDANTLLGLHRINITTNSGTTWNNGYPDRSRHVVVNGDYNHSTARLSARKLEIDNNSKLVVTNNLLVVTNDVNLTNANDEIRLVGTSQLVQTHTDATKVSGLGKLLVDQNSTVPSFYRYNYMSSPVTSNGTTYSLETVFKDGTTPLAASNTIQDITFVGGYDGNHNTNPISLASYWIYTYSPSTDGRSNWAQRYETGTIAAGDGFIFKGPGVAQNYTFTGIPNDGNLDASNIGAGQSYLVGNPFSSAINVKKFIEDNESSLTGTLYFWQHASEVNSQVGTSTGHNFAGYIGGYATRTIDLGVAANAYTVNQSNGTSGTGTGHTYDAPGLYIPIGQGFFIEGDATGGAVVFNNSQREFIDEAAGVSVFFKGEETASKNTGNHENTVPIIKLGMDYLNEQAISIHRQIGISFNPNNTFEYEKGYDAGIYDISTTDFYWKFPTDDTKYVISGIQDITSDLEVPLEITMGYSGEVSITVDEIKNVSENVYIIDKTTGIFYEIINTKAVLNLNEGVYTDRFVLAFKPNTTLSTDDIIDNAYTNVYADNKNHTLVISKNLEVDITNVELYNILGEKVSLWKIKKQNNSYKLDIKKQIPTGVYIVRLNTSKGEINKKIVIE